MLHLMQDDIVCAVVVLANAVGDVVRSVPCHRAECRDHPAVAQTSLLGLFTTRRPVEQGDTVPVAALQRGAVLYEGTSIPSTRISLNFGRSTVA